MACRGWARARWLYAAFHYMRRSTTRLFRPHAEMSMRYYFLARMGIQRVLFHVISRWAHIHFFRFRYVWCHTRQYQRLSRVGDADDVGRVIYFASTRIFLFDDFEDALLIAMLSHDIIIMHFLPRPPCCRMAYRIFSRARATWGFSRSASRLLAARRDDFDRDFIADRFMRACFLRWKWAILEPIYGTAMRRDGHHFWLSLLLRMPTSA